MRTHRAVLVGLTAAALLITPGLASASVPPSTGAKTLTSHPTEIRWMPFDHMKPAGVTMTIVGQVTAKARGERGALAGATVKLYRRLDGNPTWVYLATQRTGSGEIPQFRFNTLTRQNASYRVDFVGNSTFRPTSGTTWLDVYRSFHGVIKDGSGAATLSGNVTPYYTHKPITLQRRSCAPCGYTDYKKATTGTNGAYTFRLPAPPSGRWWWRVRTPGTTAFITSYGGTFTTQLK